MEENKKIEILFPEFCNLYGDLSNMKYLKKCIPNACFIETAFNDEPYFLNNDVNLIYLGPMTERMQEKVIKKLKPYKEKIEELIDKGTVFLVTGNSLEIFGSFIENEDQTRIDGLGIFNIYAKRDMLHRHNSMFIGKFEEIEIVGFKSQFTFSFGDNENYYFSEAEKGIGINPDSKYEGIMKNNFIGTYLIGPILIINPYFTKKVLEKMGLKDKKLAYEEDVIDAYNKRLEEFKRVQDC